jgi:acetyl-CoA carboxylase biotin carboxylase subunit
MFKKVLIANRGEIALRIIRACREMGLKTVAIYSEADKESLHLRYADECYCVGPAQPEQSYLNIDKIIRAAKSFECEAIHPGYGFLAQIPSFAKTCESNKIEFIGPSSDALKKMSSKIKAREIVAKVGVPVIPGSIKAVESEEAATEVAENVGYPVLVKAVYGGGGRGMRIANNKKDISQAMELARLEADFAFGNPKLYVEKLLTKPRHIEFQLMIDKKGNVIHLGERDCSIQRRYQKLVEETPSPIMTDELRKNMAQAAIQVAKAVNYTNAGTVEFLVDKERHFYFLEMNTRLQVEHLITEMVTGVDMVKEQIKIAAGEELTYKQDDIAAKGHAINCRINCEDPYNDFAPCPGTVTRYHAPGGFGIRVDSSLYSGYSIPVFYDSLIAKLAVWGVNRSESIQRIRNALDELEIEGVETTIPFHKKIVNNEYFRRGEVDTCFVTERIGDILTPERFESEKVAALSAALVTFLTKNRKGLAVIPKRVTRGRSWWRIGRR